MLWRRENVSLISTNMRIWILPLQKSSWKTAPYNLVKHGYCVGTFVYKNFVNSLNISRSLIHSLLAILANCRPEAVGRLNRFKYDVLNILFKYDVMMTPLTLFRPKSLFVLMFSRFTGRENSHHFCTSYTIIFV